MPSTQSENSGSVCLTKLARSEALVSAAVDVFAFSEATLATLYSGAAAAAIFAPDWSLGHALSYMVMSAVWLFCLYCSILFFLRVCKINLSAILSYLS